MLGLLIRVVRVRVTCFLSFFFPSLLCFFWLFLFSLFISLSYHFPSSWEHKSLVNFFNP